MPKRSKPKTKKTTSKKKVAAGVGAGLALVAAAAAGTYFLYGTKAGAKKRKQIRGWSLKARGEVLERLEKLGDVNEKVYRQVVDEVLSRYEKLKDVDVEELKRMGKELKGHWKHIAKDIERKTSGSIRKTKRSTKRTARRRTTKGKSS